MLVGEQSGAEIRESHAPGSDLVQADPSRIGSRLGLEGRRRHANAGRGRDSSGRKSRAQ